MNTVFDLVKVASSKVGFLDAQQERDLIAKAQAGDKKASSDLFCANSRFILKQAAGFTKTYSLSIEEAFSAACVGYLKAIEKYDFKKETRLVTIARWWILNAIQDEAYSSHLIRIPHGKIGLLKEENRDSADSVQVNAVLNAAGGIASLNAMFKTKDDDSGCLEDTFDSDISDPFEDFENAERKRLLAKAMKENLSPRENFVIRANFGFDGKSYSLSEIGRMLGCSKQRADQLKKSALKKLRSPRVCHEFRDLVA